VALFFAGQKCRLCDAPMSHDERLFATWGVFFPREDPLWPLCDAPLHWDCYAAWPERPRFARAYFSMWMSASKQNPHWGTLLADDDVLVTLNPSPAIGKVQVVLAATGTRYFVKLADWPTFATSGPPEFPHAVEAEALAAILPRLGTLGLDGEALAARAVFPRRGGLRE